MTGGRIKPDALLDFSAALMAAHGVDQAQSSEVACNMIWSELVGRENFGLSRLPLYLERVRAGGLNCPCTPRLDETAAGTALLDADGGFGQYAGRLGMEHAIAMARQHGTGTVGVRNSNFFGTGAYFVHLAADAGMIGLAMSNSFPKVAAHGGLKPVLGTNPFAFGAPRQNGESLMFDMATSALAGSTVRAHKASSEPLPEGLAIDGAGNPVTDPAKVDDGALLPAGGAKGYGLALFVELLAGVITGAGVSTGVASMYKDVDQVGRNGHFFMAIDISRFLPMESYYQRLEGLVSLLKASQPNGEVLLPGETRWDTYKANSSVGIELAAETRAQLERLNVPHGISLPWSQPVCAA